MRPCLSAFFALTLGSSLALAGCSSDDDGSTTSGAPSGVGGQGGSGASASGQGGSAAAGKGGAWAGAGQGGAFGGAGAGAGGSGGASAGAGGSAAGAAGTAGGAGGAAGVAGGAAGAAGMKSYPPSPKCDGQPDGTKCGDGPFSDDYCWKGACLPQTECVGQADLAKCSPDTFGKEYCYQGVCQPASSCVGKPNLDQCGTQIFDSCWDQTCHGGGDFSTACWDVTLTPSGPPTFTNAPCDAPKQWFKFKTTNQTFLTGTPTPCPDGKQCVVAGGVNAEFGCVAAFVMKKCDYVGDYACCPP